MHEKIKMRQEFVNVGAHWYLFIYFVVFLCIFFLLSKRHIRYNGQGVFHKSIWGQILILVYFYIYILYIINMYSTWVNLRFLVGFVLLDL